MSKREISEWATAVLHCLLADPGGGRSSSFKFYDLWITELRAAWHGYKLTELK